MAEDDQAFVSTRPSFHLNGNEREELQEAVMNMHVNLPINGMSYAEIKLANWAMPEGGDNSDFAFLDINLGDTLDVYMGEENPTNIFCGEITAIEELYGDGSPQIILLIQDKLHRLARIRKSKSFDDMSLGDVISAVATDSGLTADVSLSSMSGTFHQINESNLAFLLRLLAPLDVALRLDGNSLRVRDEEQDQEPFLLDAQDNANNVRLLVDLNHQITATTFMGFNASNNNSVNGRHDSHTPAPAGKTASDHLKALGWKGEDHYPQPFPQTQTAADDYATGQFKKHARRFINGDIRCRGEASLKSGREIELEGVTDRLKGRYQIVNCVHSFNASDGYESRLKVNRADWDV